MRTPTPRKVKVPPIEHYGETTDPINHLVVFKAQMSMQTGSEVAWYKLFPTTLNGLAITWFTELPPRSISNFAALEAAFKQNFIAGRRHQKTSIHLMSIRQHRDDDLAEYIKRFNEGSLKVSDLQVSVAFTELMSGIYPSSRFKLKVAERETSPFSEAMNLTQRFIQAFDIFKMHEVRIKESTSMLLERTPLGTSLKKIYLDIKEKYTLPKPNPIKIVVNRRDKRLWCEYHHDYGHTTRDCRELKRALKIKGSRERKDVTLGARGTRVSPLDTF